MGKKDFFCGDFLGFHSHNWALLYSYCFCGITPFPPHFLGRIKKFPTHLALLNKYRNKEPFFLHWQMVHFAGLFAGCFFYYLGSQLIDKTLCNCWKHALLMYTLFSRDSLTAIKLTTSALFSLRASAHPMYLQLYEGVTVPLLMQ